MLLPQLPALLPSFARVPLGRNRLKDLIAGVEVDLPVDPVSKKYRLIQHFEIVEAVAAAADSFGIDADTLRAQNAGRASCRHTAGRNSVTERTAWRAQIGMLVQQLALD